MTFYVLSEAIPLRFFDPHINHVPLLFREEKAGGVEAGLTACLREYPGALLEDLQTILIREEINEPLECPV